MKVRAKAGGEGTVVFDSAIALLQGLFPPNSRNRITLADGTVVTAPLGGYQYVPSASFVLTLFPDLMLTDVLQLRRWNPATTALWRAGRTVR